MTARSLLFALVVAIVMSLRPAAAGVLEGVPDVIVCGIGKGKMVVYVSRRLDDGSTVYASLEREFTAIITIDTKGILHWQNREGCDGKSIDQLRQEGKAFDFGG